MARDPRLADLRETREQLWTVEPERRPVVDNAAGVDRPPRGLILSAGLRLTLLAVVACLIAGPRAGAAGPAEAQTPPSGPPAKPTGLTGTITHESVSLSWDDPGDASITGYQILRRQPAIPRRPYASPASTRQSHRGRPSPVAGSCPRPAPCAAAHARLVLGASIPRPSAAPPPEMRGHAPKWITIRALIGSPSER